MKVDKYLWRVLWTLRAMVLHAYYSIVLERVLIGADTVIESMGEQFPAYLSCSEPPPEYADTSGMDDYGICNGLIYAYASGLNGLIKDVWQGGREGWRVLSLSLIYLDYLDD